MQALWKPDVNENAHPHKFLPGSGWIWIVGSAQFDWNPIIDFDSSIFYLFSSQLWFSSSLPSLPIPCFSRFMSQYFWLDWFLSNNSPLPVYSQAHTRIDSTTHSYRRFHNPHLHSCSAVIRIPSSGSRISSKSSSSSLLSLLSSSSWSAYAPEHYHLFDQCWCGSGQLMNQFTLRREFSRFLPVMDLVSWKPRSITSRGKKERLRSRFYSTGPNKAGVH